MERKGEKEEESYEESCREREASQGREKSMPS